MDARELSATIKREAARLGFTHCHVTPSDRAPHADFYDRWIDAGRANDMHYLERTRALRRDPALLVDSTRAPVRSIIVLAQRYRQAALPPAVLTDPSRGILASYAWDDDYHETIRPRLHALDESIRRRTGRSDLAKALVDSGPVLERDWAQRAGIGFTGKNTCTIHPVDGSWLLLATLLVPEVLAYDAQPHPSRAEPAASEVLGGMDPAHDFGTWPLVSLETTRTGTCGHCTRCLDLCPTHAFVGPFHLDPTRCISYWTIETRKAIPRALRPAFGNRIFGCDICQEVCPWNRGGRDQGEVLDGTAAHRFAPPLLEGFSDEAPYWLNVAAFKARFARSPVLRATRAGMLRTVCVALGNWGDPAALPALDRALFDEEEVVRGHAAWAIGRVLSGHQSALAHEMLAAALRAERAESVREEIACALGARA